MIDELIKAAEEVVNDEHFSGEKIKRLLTALRIINELSDSEIEWLDKIAECLQWSKESQTHVREFAKVLNEKIFSGR